MFRLQHSLLKWTGVMVLWRMSVFDCCWQQVTFKVTQNVANPPKVKCGVSTFFGDLCDPLVWLFLMFVTPFADLPQMDVVMRNGLLGTVMCLAGLQPAINCQANWKNSKNSHYQLTKSKFISTTEDLEYFANSLSNEKNFVKNLDTILIPRTVGSEGSRIVRDVSSTGNFINVI